MKREFRTVLSVLDAERELFPQKMPNCKAMWICCYTMWLSIRLSEAVGKASHRVGNIVKKENYR